MSSDGFNVWAQELIVIVLSAKRMMTKCFLRPLNDHGVVAVAPDQIYQRGLLTMLYQVYKPVNWPRYLATIIPIVMSHLWCAIPCYGAEMQVIRGHVPDVLSHLKPVGVLDSKAVLNLAIGLPFRNQDALNDLLKRMYTPERQTPLRGLTSSQFTEMFGPTQQDYDALLHFAQTNKLDVVKTYPNRTILDVRAPADIVAKVFHTKLLLYQHPTEQRSFYAPAIEPSIDLKIPILHITGFDNFSLPQSPLNLLPLKQRFKPVPYAGSGPKGCLRGNDFRTAYVPNVSLKGSGQVVGILESDGYYQTDITAYEVSAGLPSVSLQNVFLDGFSGPTGDTTGNIEASMDIEMVLSMAPGVSKIVIYGFPHNTAAIIDALNEVTNPTQGEPRPNQISTSFSLTYGGSNPSIYQAFMQMAAQRQTFFGYSGDQGAYTPYTGNPPEVEPFPPGDYPFVTSVGGTVLTTDTKGNWQSETAWGGSGGGPSPWFPISMAPWQQGVDMTSNHGSTTQRNCPDVAMAATNICVFFGKGLMTVTGGTSASTPLWAGFNALVNERALADGEEPDGFINPALWAIGKGACYKSAFHDIADGSTNANSLSGGNYSAVPGYDLTTGWGTPNGMNLISALAAFQQHGPNFTCTSPPKNACGGSATLFAAPGGGCTASGKCGRYKCIGTDSVTCDTSQGSTNGCGGCGLMNLPGTGRGKGDRCTCNSAALEEGVLVCSNNKNRLICCPCGSAPGCGPGSPPFGIH